MLYNGLICNNFWDEHRLLASDMSEAWEASAMASTMSVAWEGHLNMALYQESFRRESNAVPSASSLSSVGASVSPSSSSSSAPQHAVLKYYLKCK